MSGFVTMKQVARQAGVSHPTVSDVLRGAWRAKGISAATREKVLRAVKELGYRPNRLARGLSGKSSRIVGIILPPHARKGYDSYVGNLTAGLVGQLRLRDYRSVMEYATDEFIKREEYIELFREGLVEALVLVAAEQVILDRLHEHKLPFVLLNFRDPHRDSPCVLEDAAGMARRVVGHLRGLGRRRLCYVTAPVYSTKIQDRLSAYETAFSRTAARSTAGRIVHTQHISSPVPEGIRRRAGRHTSVSGSAFPESIMRGYEVGPQILALRSRPDAVIAMNDWVAYGIMLFLQDEGLRVPEDISIIGWDNMDWSVYVRPALTTVDIHPQEFGRMGGELLLQLIDGKAAPHAGPITVPGELVIRESCGAKEEAGRKGKER